MEFDTFFEIFEKVIFEGISINKFFTRLKIKNSIRLIFSNIIYVLISILFKKFRDASCYKKIR
jgi:hypothetical protein